MKKWLKVGFGWGLGMYILMVFIFPFLKREPITFNTLIIGFFWWMIGGLLFGLLMRKNFSN